MPVPSESSSPPPPEPSPGGLAGSLRDLWCDAQEYAAARWALFQLEAQRAAGHFTRVAIAAAVVLLGAAVGYVALWAVVLIFAARQWCGGDFLPPVAVMAGVHLLAAGLAAWWLVRRGKGQALFNATRREFQEDQQWLNRRTP